MILIIWIQSYLMELNHQNQRIRYIFKKYYQEKLRGVKHHCEICNKDIAKDKKARHANTKVHMRKLNEKLYSTYSEFD